MMPIYETPGEVLTVKEALAEVDKFVKKLPDGEYLLHVELSDFQDKFELSRAVVKR